MLMSTMTQMLDNYLEQLVGDELSVNTIVKYSRDIRFFLCHSKEKQSIGKKEMIAYKNFLIERYKISTVNSYLISINRYLTWLGVGDITVKTLRIQRKANLENIITYEEYNQLLHYCLRNNRQRDYLILRIIAATGIRVGELVYITYEAARSGGAEIFSKSKCRQILIPEELSDLLLSYCDEKGITAGIIFRGPKENSVLCTKSIWKLFKRVAIGAGVDASKVYPHNLRHLFAKTYMQKIGNVFELADILGHSSIETTRIYALSSHEEKRKSLGMLEL